MDAEVVSFRLELLKVSLPLLCIIKRSKYLCDDDRIADHKCNEISFASTVFGW
jgi:hypothetical protein